MVTASDAVAASISSFFIFVPPRPHRRGERTTALRLCGSRQSVDCLSCGKACVLLSVVIVVHNGTVETRLIAAIRLQRDQVCHRSQISILVIEMSHELPRAVGAFAHSRGSRRL